MQRHVLGARHRCCPLLPRAPVYLLNTRPWPRYALFFASNTLGVGGVEAGGDVGGQHARKRRRARRSGSRPPSPASSMTSAMVFSKNCEAMPVAPTLPISSLSTSTHTAVRSGSSPAQRPAAPPARCRRIRGHPARSPCTMERSKPRSRARPAGTTSSSAERKSSSLDAVFIGQQLQGEGLHRGPSGSLASPSSSRTTSGRLPTSMSKRLAFHDLIGLLAHLLVRPGG